MRPERARGSTPWLHRLAVLLALWALLLIAVGGLVTTYRVGMAVPDWPTTFGYGMFSYPLDEMLRNFGVTVEHSHRLLASSIGLISIVTVIVAAHGLAPRGRSLVYCGLAVEAGATARLVLQLYARVVGPDGARAPVGLDSLTVGMLVLGALAMIAGAALVRARAAIWCAILVHFAIVGQGLLGGSRVLENASDLAFLHGALAQIVYATIGALVTTSSSAFQAPAPGELAGTSLPARRAWLTTVLLYCQIVLGAWLRHSGRSDALAAHVVFALVASGAILWLARGLRGLPGGHPLARLRTLLLAMLGAQIALGLMTTVAIYAISQGFQGRVSLTEAISATAHVASGAVLLACTSSSALWLRRLCSARVRVQLLAPDLGGSPA